MLFFHLRLEHFPFAFSCLFFFNSFAFLHFLLDFALQFFGVRVICCPLFLRPFLCPSQGPAREAPARPPLRGVGGVARVSLEQEVTYPWGGGSQLLFF